VIAHGSELGAAAGPADPGRARRRWRRDAAPGRGLRPPHGPGPGADGRTEASGGVPGVGGAVGPADPGFGPDGPPGAGPPAAAPGETRARGVGPAAAIRVVVAQPPAPGSGRNPVERGFGRLQRKRRDAAAVPARSRGLSD
jgi:hypothetical protein